MAADFQYHEDIASEEFNLALSNAGQDGLGRSYWPTGVMSLAIEPLYSPAILTVGTHEYIAGRIEGCMSLFMTLTGLPADEEDLDTIIDKAGDFLIDDGDYERALALYQAAEEAYPNDALYLIGSGYCLGKLGRHEDSVAKHRRADALQPDNYLHLNDLGHSLYEAGMYEEAERVLERSIALAPSDYDFARNNLEDLRRKRKEGR